MTIIDDLKQLRADLLRAEQRSRDMEAEHIMAAASLGACFASPGLGNTGPAPRRRTEPAITVPPPYVGTMWKVGDVVRHKTYIHTCGRIAELWSNCGELYSARLEGHVSFWSLDQLEHVPDTRPVYAPAEVEAIVAFGSAAYACMAADCDQVRELLAVEEAKAAMEVWRLENADWLDHYTDGDSAAELGRDMDRAREQFVDEWETWLAALTPPAEGATIGDWAAAQPTPPTVWSREYMQHLYDKLAKGEVVGG